MDIFQAVILGIVEGLTEFLPVSSTAHLIVTTKLLGLDISNSFIKTFQIVIQLGAMLAVIFLYGRKVLESKELFGKILFAFIPTAVVGLALYPIIKGVFLGSVHLLSISLIVGGFVMIIIEKYFVPFNKSDLNKVSWGQAFSLGLFQSLAVIPGVSRSGATIMGGLLMGINRASIAEFSFLLAVPTIAAASFFDAFNSFGQISRSEWEILLVGLLVSFIVSILVIKWLMKFIKTNTFTGFGVYRIVIGLLFVIWLV